MSTIVSEISTLPPANCAPWCEDGDGHPTAKHPEDQYCTTDAVRVGLTRHALIPLDCGEWRRDDLRAYLMRERFAAEPHVSIGHGDAPVVDLTLDEAEAHALALLELVRRARA